MKDCAIPCPGCPNVQLGISASGESNVPNVAMGPDGSVSYAQITADGASMGQMSASYIAEQYPVVARAIEECEKPATEEVIVKRRGPLGWLGLQKTVIQVECSAVSESELQAMAIKHGRG